MIYRFVFSFLLAIIFFNRQDLSDKEIKKQPNIIFILTDDLGYGDLGILYQKERKEKNNRSKPWMSTPNLDQMAREGIILSNHYVAAPVCAPSRASLLTGLSQGHANVRDNQFDKALADNHNIANLLKKIGYSTVAIGKWGLQGDNRWGSNGSDWPAVPTKRGFDYFFGYITHVAGHEHYPKEKLYRNKSQVWENNKDVTDVLDKCYTTDLWTAKAKQWISNKVNEGDSPFFMYLAYDTPHAVLELPTQKYPEGRGISGGLKWLGGDGYMINTATGIPDSYIHPDYQNNTYDHDNDNSTAEIPWPETYKRYATSVRRIDDSVGDLLKLLSDLNIDDNTLVIFTSDNGPSKESYLGSDFVENNPTFFDSYGPFNGIKRDVLEGGLRVPLIARWPNNIPANSFSDSPSIMYDWLPTFLDIAGYPAPAYSDGVSLKPVILNQTNVNSNIYVEYNVGGHTPDYEAFSNNNRNKLRKQMQMIRLDNYVGIRYDIVNPNKDFEIYDILKDKSQSNNLASNLDFTEIQNEMKAKVLRQRRIDTTALRPYDSLFIPSIKRTKNIKAGLKWYAYKGNYDWLPELTMLSPEDFGIIDDFRSFDFSNQSNNLFLLQGLIDIPENGIYTFEFQSSEKAIIKLHQAILFDADYNYQPNTVLSDKLILEKGLHPITIYLQNNGKTNNPLQLKWKSNKGASIQKFYFDN